ncbi:reverse transcriptase domain-containing protein [Tanacetum coccineum]
MSDNRTMAQLLEAPTEGYEDSIVVPEITADNFKLNHAPTPVKAVEESCVTCGGAHSYRNCPAIDGNVYRDNIQEYASQAAAANFNQGNTDYRAPIANQIRPPGFPPIQQNQGNNQNRYNQNRGNNYNQSQIYQPPINQPPVPQAQPYQAPAPQTQGVTKTDFESYVKANDAVMRNMQDQNQNLQNQMTNLTDMLSKFVNSNTASTSGSGTLPSNTITNPKVDLKGITTRSGVAYQGPTIPTTSSSPPKVVERETEVTKDTVPPTNNRSTKDVQPPVVQTERALIDVYEGELTLRVGKEAVTFNLDQTLRYSSNYNDMTTNRIDVIEMACEEYSQEVLGFSDVISSGNPTPYYDPIVSTSSPTLTPFGDSDFLLEEVDAFLALEDDPTSPEDLPPHLEYAFLEGDNKLPVIIAKDLSVEEKAALIKVLKSHKRAIAWKLSDIKGINPEFCTHKILMEEDYKPAVQHQRRVNPKIHDVIKKEVEKLLDAGLIYPISDSPWLNEATRKDHFPLSFMDQMLKRLAGNDYYCFLDGFSGYLQIPIDPHDQEKTTFTYPYGNFRLPFACLLALCNATRHVQRDDVDKAKVDVIAKLPHPTTVKDWDLPFELMCDASDFAIGAVLGQRHEKHFRPIHYASKTMNEAESHYTTTEKEMLARGFQSKIAPVGSPPSRAKKLLTSSQLAIVDPPGDITVPTTPPKRFLTQDFIGPRFTKMPMTWSPDVTLVSVKEKFRSVMKCLKIPSKFAKSLTYGA